MTRGMPLAVAGIVILCCVGGGLWLRAGSATADGGAATVPVIPKIDVATARTQDMPVYVRGTGTVEPFQQVTVKSLVDGQITATHFEEGQMVKAGDPLFTIDPRPFEHQVELATANRAKDQAQLAAAQAQLARSTSLLQHNFVSQQDFDTQKATVGQLLAVVRADEAGIGSAQLQLDYSTIRAPIAGRVGKRMVDVGNVIHTADDTALVDLSQIQPISVSFTVPQERLPDIQREAEAAVLKVEARAADDEHVLGVGDLKLIGNAIDRSTGTIALKAVFGNADRQLWPGQFVNGRLVLRTHRDAIVVPGTCVRPGPEGPVAYVVDAQNRIRVRPVKLGEKAHDLIAILDGIKPGDRVVLHRQEGLAEGTEVEIRPAAGGS
ncbi:MAG TPA: efflux RND transporter periplasmic adaptor subunit [Aliidongia sp.]|uniref:efflux RND transporter periplasmic adaptor subunit n=1 Tax=Aliidongia sp. TaxID=1914230 RepID=UPI002DDD546A|nr:efflux RND transporter periplasmic adaptor subunit [Aliidongia sp.]HEV2676671.1 efflux RND transporter periplasmic adaptor subunit [Aliidongia sp.]